MTMAQSPRSGWRGYISPRPVRGSRTPQHVQNLVIRDYAQRNGLLFKLSATEYVMPDCYMMLAGVLEELPTLEGVIAYSLFMLPPRRSQRRAVYARVLQAGAGVHFALEGISLLSAADIQPIEDIWTVQQALDRGEPGAGWIG